MASLPCVARGSFDCYTGGEVVVCGDEQDGGDYCLLNDEWLLQCVRVCVCVFIYVPFLLVSEFSRR